MQRAIRTALLTAIRNLGLYYYSSPPSRDVAGSWLEIVAELDSDADIVDRTCGGSNSERGRKALESLLLVREQGARTSEPRENCMTLGSPLCRGLTKATYILCIEHPRRRRDQASRPGIEPGTSYTAGEHSMQRAIRTALLTAIRNLGLYYYSKILLVGTNLPNNEKWPALNALFRRILFPNSNHPTTRRLAGNVFLFFEVHMCYFELRLTDCWTDYFLLESYNTNLNKTDEFSGYIFPSVKSTNLLVETFTPYNQIKISEEQ
jgi:hypothetical protein